ncbi:MAG: ABC transporter permease subunit [Nitrospiraceae bacterium]|nr:ABC transporter permease subunit [Nitrospiraceae bacterium]
MKNVLTILRRDLRAYFTSPIGYIFMIVYVLMSVGLYITSFFAFPVADMRGYFGNLPLMLCVFIPAVTMRVWAEERKENTWEMLLTFPMNARQLVLGKFLATFVFFAVTVAATFTIPLMLAALGNPDNGAILGGYVGALLLGAFFIAIGIFFSGFFKDQIVAFVVTLLACFALFLVGTNFIAGYIDSAIPGLGSLLMELVGVVGHYDAFMRGVFELADILYFVAWTTLLLMLNVMYIEARGRHNASVTFAGAVVLCMAIGLLFNWLLIGTSLARWDATEDKIYTMSDASKAILSRLETPVKVKLYITPKNKMPTLMSKLEQDITDKIEELQAGSGGKIDFSTMYLEAANVLADARKTPGNEEDEEKALETRMLDKGVEPFSVNAVSEDQQTSMLVYSSIGVGYKNKKEEIIPQMMPQTLPELEYRLVSTIYKLTRERAPVVALVAPKEAVNIPPEYRRLMQQMGQPVPTSDDPYMYLERILQFEKYDVRRVELTQESPLPDEYDVLAVVNPRALNERQRWEISRALASGKSVLMAVQNYEWDYRATRNGREVTKREENPQVNELLNKYGLGIDDDILMDANYVGLTVQSSANTLAALMGGGQTFELPTQMLINNESMDQETSITSRLSTIFYLWGSALTLDEDTLKKHGLEAKTIMSTSERAWTVPADVPVFDMPSSGLKQYPLMAMVAGQFPDVYKDAERPAWPQTPQMPGQPPRPPVPEEGGAEPITLAPGKLVLMGCSEMFRKNFLQQGNLDLFLNSVDAIALGDELVHVRSRKAIDRAITRPEAGTRRFWKTVNYTFATIVIGAIGIVSAMLRKRSRNAYTIAHGNAAE